MFFFSGGVFTQDFESTRKLLSTRQTAGTGISVTSMNFHHLDWNRSKPISKSTRFSRTIWFCNVFFCWGARVHSRFWKRTKTAKYKANCRRWDFRHFDEFSPLERNRSKPISKSNRFSSTIWFFNVFFFWGRVHSRFWNHTKTAKYKANCGTGISVTSMIFHHLAETGPNP